MRRSISTSVRVGGAALMMAAMSLAGPAPAKALSDKDLPASMHGAVETQAITVGNGVVSLLVDPGTAYAYSTLDRDDYGGGSTNFSMTARGANVNLGTIAYAVLWPAPDCESRNVTCTTSGQFVYGSSTSPTGYDGPAPTTGIHEAKGFPMYAEALYPPPPEGGGPSQERVYKCIANKDGAGSPPTYGEQESVCKSSDSIPMTAWAETVAPEYRSTGFSRAAGFNIGALAVRGSESFSDVRALEGAKSMSTGYSNVYGVEILKDMITIDSVRSTSTIVSSAAGVDTKASTSTCTFSGLTVAGQHFDTKESGFENGVANPQLQGALDKVAAATGYKVEIIPPYDTDLAQVDEGKFVAGCGGLQVKFTDTHTAAPLLPCSPVEPPQPGANNGLLIPSCAPALGNREEFTFGKISVQQAVSDFSFFDSIGDTQGAAEAADVGGGDFATPTGSDAAAAVPAAGAGDLGLGSGSGSASMSVSTGKSAKKGGSGSRGSQSIAGYQPASAGGTSPTKVGALTAAAGISILFGALVLIGVVNSMATGRRFRLPGT